MRRIEFIASLFLFGLFGLIIGGMNLYEQLEFYFNGQPAQMELADLTKTRVIPPSDPDIVLMDVRYISANGELVVKNKKLWGTAAQVIGKGGRVPITYLKHSPELVLYEGQEPDNPWGYLAPGIISMWTFFYACKLRRREESSQQ